MFDWLIKLMFTAAINAAQYFIGLIISTFNFNLTYFTTQIPIVAESYAIFQAMGVGFVLLFMIWQVFKTFGAPIGIEGDDPIKVFFKSILALFCIYNAQTIFNIGFILLSPVHSKIMALQTGGFVGKDANASSVVSGVVTSVLQIFTSAGTAEIIVYGIILLIILFQLLKMLIEITERYILIGILAVTAPLGFSTMNSKGTEKIFAAWSRMAIGQFIIYLLNIWILKMFLSAFSTMQTIKIDDGAGIVWLIFMWAFVKVAQKMDQFLGKLGIEVGNAGGSLMEELMVARMVMGPMGGKGGSGGIAGALKGGGGIASAMKTAATGGAFVAGTGLLGRAAGAIGRGAKSQYAKSPVAGLMRYSKNIGSSAFKNAKTANATGRAAAGKKNSSFRGVASNNLAGAKAWASEGLKYATGQNARAGAKLAAKLNAPPSSDIMKSAPNTVGDKQLNELKNPSVAANALGNLHKANDGGDVPKAMFNGLCEGESLGGLPKELVDNGTAKLTAYNGGIAWSYEEDVTGIGINKHEGIIAVDGNNDASRHVVNMKNKPGVSSESFQSNGINMSYASKKTFVPNKPRYDQKKKEFPTPTSTIYGTDGKPIHSGK